MRRLILTLRYHRALPCGWRLAWYIAGGCRP